MEVGRRLRWPILLVVPCQNSGRSITAAIQGFVAEAGGPEHFAGIILNQVNSESHADYLSKACASLQIPIFGSFTRNSGTALAGTSFGTAARSGTKASGSRSIGGIGGKIF